MDIAKDSRLISLDTNYAKKLNGDFNSNLFFEMDTIVEENPKITHIEVSLEDATIPVSWYLINNDTRTLKYRYNLTDYTLTLKKGNYTSTSLLGELSSLFLFQGLTATCTLDKQSGKSLFVFSNTLSDITFLHSGSEGLFRLLGFLVDTDYNGTTIESPTPMNLLGIQKLNLSSQSLATISSFSSSPLLGNCLIQTIPVDQPSFNQITFINRGSHFGRMKSRSLKNIDIQLQDEFGRFIEMNNTNFTLTIQLIIFRKVDVSIENIFLPRLLEKIKEEDAKRQEQKKNEPKDDELELLST
jgi:hypothetical protein